MIDVTVRNEYPICIIPLKKILETSRADKKLADIPVHACSFPTEIDSTASELIPSRRIFWSRNTFDNMDDVQDKIKSAFCNVNAARLKGLLQFWAPVKTTIGSKGSILLSSSEQLFALEDRLNPRVHNYRLFSLKCRDSIVEVNNEDSSLVMISNGRVTTAFLDHFPDVVMDLKFHKGLTPLVDKALDCGLSCLILLHVFYSSSCVGVVECCLKKLTSTNLVVTFNKLKTALESVGLTTYQLQEPLLLLPYNEAAIMKDEIEDALKIACESHCLSLAQVWVAPNGIENFVVKLSGYCHPDPYDDNHDALLDYYNTCNSLPLKTGDGLPGKTLETHESRFCEDLSNLKKIKGEGLLGLLGRNTDCSCLVMCLRTTATGYFNYAFEFLWPESRNPSILLKSLVLTLKMCLPSFQFAGQDLRVVDLDRCTRNEIASFKILHGDILLLSIEASLSLKEDLKRTPLPLKRKSGSLNDYDDSETYSDSESYSDFSENDDQEEEEDMFFVGDYEGTMKLLPLEKAYTLTDAKQKIETGFNLAPGTFTLEYRFNEGSFKLNTNEDLVRWIKCWRCAKKGYGHDINFTLYVVSSSDQQHVVLDN